MILLNLKVRFLKFKEDIINKINLVHNEFFKDMRKDDFFTIEFNNLNGIENIFEENLKKNFENNSNDKNLLSSGEYSYKRPTVFKDYKTYDV